MKSTLLCVILVATAFAQDAATGALRGTVTDPTGARVDAARIIVTNSATGLARDTVTTIDGTFAIDGLPPGDYSVRIEAPGMAATERTAITVDLGSQLDLAFTLRLAGTRETVTVPGGTPLVETQPAAVSSVIDERAISDLPLNGRRFSDLALLSPGVTDDPRSLTSGSHGDLAFGGIRGLHTSFLVDGADNNNAFFAQARGRYRSPYQFSNEVIHEFRVSSNTYGADLGRSGGAVINVATRSGSNYTHGSAFYYLRDSRFNARHPFTSIKPSDRQHQFGFTLGGPIRKDKVFYFGGFDQHIFHVPTLVPIHVVPRLHTPGNQGDYEDSDKALVFAAADRLNQMGGTYHSALLGNAGFAKLDWNLSTRHHLSARLNTSRYYGSNNVYFDPAGPISWYSMSTNGEELVATESASLSLTSALSYRLTSALRLQFSHDRQQSRANSEDVLQQVSGIIEGFGRAPILPRLTNERRLHLAETLSLQGRRHTWKFGGDLHLTWIRNYFPLMFGGQYTFDDIRVNQFSFEPQPYGLKLTPLRAFAHAVPRYYSQNFGSSISHPDTNEYAFFVQDAIRVTSRLGVNLGLRYDLQTFRTGGLVSNPLWPGSGKLPSDHNNVAPRVGFAYSLGDARPLVIRGGWGMFYPRIPQIYNSAVENDNGLNQSHLFLDNYDYWDRVVFPAYPSPLVSCPSGVTYCAPPPQLANKLTTQISAFARDFHTPVVQQASLGVEKEVARRLALGAHYLYVHGQGLIRSRDVNLPRPVQLTYPVFDESGTNFLGEYYTVDSFSTWQMTESTDCPFTPCLNDVARPIPQLGAINQFESAASSIYHGLTLSIRRRMTSPLFPPGLHLGTRHRRRPGPAHHRPPRQRAEHLRHPGRARLQRHRPAPAFCLFLDRRAPALPPRAPGFARPFQPLENVRSNHRGQRTPLQRPHLRRRQRRRQQLQRPPPRRRPQRLRRPRLRHHRPAPRPQAPPHRTLASRVPRRVLQPVQPRQQAYGPQRRRLPRRRRHFRLVQQQHRGPALPRAVPQARQLPPAGQRLRPPPGAVCRPPDLLTSSRIGSASSACISPNSWYNLTYRQKLGITTRVLQDWFGGVWLLAEVRIQEGESLENALRRFKRKVQQEDIIKEVKRHSYYLKPGEKKRAKEALARKRSRKKARKEQD